MEVGWAELAAWNPAGERLSLWGRMPRSCHGWMTGKHAFLEVVPVLRCNGKP